MSDDNQVEGSRQSCFWSYFGWVASLAQQISATALLGTIGYSAVELVDKLLLCAVDSFHREVRLLFGGMKTVVGCVLNPDDHAGPEKEHHG